MKTSWEILSRRQADDDTIITTVELIIDGNEPYIIEIPHFKTEDEDAIIMNIANRSLSERKSIYQTVFIPKITTPGN